MYQANCSNTLTMRQGVLSRQEFVPVSWLKLAAAMVGKQDAAQRLCGSLQVDIEKTRRLLGWTPPLWLDEGLRRVATGPMSSQSLDSLTCDSGKICY